MEVLNFIFMVLFGIYMLFDVVLPAIGLLFGALFGLAGVVRRACSAAYSAIVRRIRHR